MKPDRFGPARNVHRAGKGMSAPPSNRSDSMSGTNAGCAGPIASMNPLRRAPPPATDGGAAVTESVGVRTGPRDTAAGGVRIPGCPRTGGGTRSPG